MKIELIKTKIVIWEGVKKGPDIYGPVRKRGGGGANKIFFFSKIKREIDAECSETKEYVFL